MPKDHTPSLFIHSPVLKSLQRLVQNQTLWTAPVIAILFASLVRWLVALNPYSGYNTPPIFGDYEAQRHWMEITIHLPFSKWYKYDLQWWGLDYPPLTAYHSWICGLIGSKINANWFALDTSRGIETEESKLFMRSTVFVSEALIYIPAVLVFCQIVYGSDSYLKKHMAAVLILLQPALMMIDHAHFQYNSVMLGLTLWAINCFLTHHFILGSVCFCLSLGFKQMALYYAPAVFAFLLGRCFTEKRGLLLFIKLGITVVITFGLLFAPWLTSLEEIKQVIARIFPVARGLYEDKVANFWCSINVIIKLRRILTLDATVKISLLTTLAFVIPIGVHLGRAPSKRRFLYAMVNSSLAFFLFSFQVHEKSILLPLLPVTLLILEEPVASTMFLNVAMFSMFPLLKRENLVIPYFVTTIMWNWLVGEYGPNVTFTSRIGTVGVHIVFILWHIAEFYTLMAQRRVVVTGLGLVTPLGVGVKTVWNNLIKSHCGIVSLADREGFKNLPVTIAAEVPKGVFEEGKFTASEWLDRGDDRIMAKFTQYAIAAAKQAIDDAEWTPKTLEEKERTASIRQEKNNVEEKYK
ncbi:ALG6, ALG8 glycosyltransferase family-domain-containing protein [Mycotypha africana]|uniref:ALG6, ALG8 glycosyltransferase family-domain-containing protein n=1 Tax=Mycotypha africana TaxID=64632 RepID=UPI0023000B4B|nr:ALG6, ALG8 glycosyltransferase family-domain-containing protein [Mycotypha africana]KAI8990887.1 ALG6, ALG8 glycosyltransferase family-domain-containing protein [Mycotypha africana]